MDLIEHQEHAFEALKQLRDILEAHHIQYWLLAGSVLGAVRHKGFIPWDDDIDVGILYEDAKKVDNLLVSQPLSGFYYISTTNSSRYPRLYGKILHKGKGCVDIFPLVRVSDNCFVCRMQWITRKVTWKLYSRKVGYRHPNEKPLWVAGSLILSKLISKSLILRISDYNCRVVLNKKTKNYINLFSIYSMEKEIIPAKCIEEWCELVFHGEMFRVPSYWDEYLTHLYGDYMTPPPTCRQVASHTEQF